MQTVASLGGFYWWEAKCSPLFSHSALFISRRLSFCTVFYGSPSLCLLWSHRKIHYVSLNHQSAGGEEPFLLCGPRCSVLKNSTNAVGKQSSLWPSHLSDAPLVTVLRHITCLALVLEVPDSSCGGFREEEGCGGQQLGHWHLHHIASTRTPDVWNISLCWIS